MNNQNFADNLTRLLAFASKTSEDDAKKIASQCSTPLQAIHTDPYVLKNMIGCSSEAVDFLRLTAALTARRMSEHVKPMKKYSAELIEEYVKGLLFGLTTECLYVLMFDAEGRFISADVLSEGTVNCASFAPRRLLDMVIKKGAKRVILAHNHPCGIVEPSSEDIETTHTAKSVLADSGVNLVAHYVVSGFDARDCMPLLAHDRD